MSFVISSVIPFPPISWWCRVLDVEKVCWDTGEHFQKMSYRNRYNLASANGLLKLSTPLQNGRDQRAPMSAINISYDQNWPLQHWRSIVSAYNRSPYFEYYQSSLEAFFQLRPIRLVDYNLAAVAWVKAQLKLSFDEDVVNDYRKDYPDAIADLRTDGIKARESAVGFPVYQQVFSDRIGFLPNLSILDLLFAEGPLTLDRLKKNRDLLCGHT